jgi:hypothetical protein
LYQYITSANPQTANISVGAHASTLSVSMRAECYLGLDLPLRHDHEDRYNEYYYLIGAYSNNRGSLSKLFFVRELAMMHLIDKLTDKPDWHEKV